jgi:signal transduction histidine kinase
MTPVGTSLSRVLVVDDDPDLAVEIRALLRGSPRGWEVDAQPTVDGLGDRLQSGSYDVWILDHHLAGMVGDQVLRLLPADVERPPVVVVTGSADPALPETYLSLGVADFLTKEELKPALLDRTLRFAVAQWQAKQALERSQHDLLRSERLATIGRMASGVAHEYNNLNAVVLAGLERLHRHVSSDPAAHDLITRVLGAVERSRRISESLLTLGRPSDGAATVIDLRPHLTDTMALMELRARRFGTALHLESDEQPCPVRIDRNDLHQVLSNLVVNALHAVHRASEPQVVVRVERHARQVVMTVRDNGVGIAADDMPRLFQPFFSRKGPHDRSGLFPASAGGTGLGLPVCQVLIARAGGDLVVSSRAGSGTTVTVTLPLCEEAPTPTPTAKPAESASGAPAVRAADRLRVVALDDNVQLCQLLHDALSDAGIPVRTHVDPLRFLAEQPIEEIDLLVLDWQMPGIGGGEVLQQLGDAQRIPPLRVLVISGEPPILPDPPPPGVVILGVVMKPFRLAELITRINGG